MQMYPSDHRGYKEQQYYSVVEEDYVYKDEYSYNNGSIMQMMKPDHSLPKHTYNHNHAHASYGGYTDHEKKGHDGHMAHYYEEERRRDSWGDHSAHAGHRHYNGEGMQHAGYGAHQAQGHYRPHPDDRKKVSAWEFKSIVD